MSDATATPPTVTTGRHEPLHARLTDAPDAGELMALQRHHGELVHALNTRLPVLLRADIAIELVDVAIRDAQALIGRITTPTHLTMFRVEPLPGGCLLEIPPKLGLTIVDRLLGGSGQGLSGERRLSDIEAALLDETVQTILATWCELWNSHTGLQLVVLGHEIDARHLPQDAHATTFVVATLRARLGDCEELIRLGLPWPTVRALLPHQRQPLAAPAPTARAPAWNELFDDVSVCVSAQYDELQLAAREVATLKVGDLLPLDATWSERIQLCLAGRPTFLGRLGTQNEKWAVELTRQLEKSR